IVHRSSSHVSYVSNVCHVYSVIFCLRPQISKFPVVSSYMAGQRIIIPRGSIRAEETNVIEIPVHLQNSSVVVAQPKEAPPEDQGMEGGCVPTCVNYNTARSRQPIAAGFDSGLLDFPASPPAAPPRARRPSQQAANRGPPPQSPPSGGRRLSQQGQPSPQRPQTPMVPQV
ncbi:unnamed protein product, partial [Callosobruchus maculatus]